MISVDGVYEAKRKGKNRVEHEVAEGHQAAG
jgi:hypothetical protein